MGLPSSLTPEAVATYLLATLGASADTPYIGEPISQLQHSLQCGWLATEASPPVDEATQVAALLHDIGQFAPAEDLAAAVKLLSASSAETDSELVRDMGPSPSQSVGRHGHESLGAQLLRALGFPEKVARLVESHVAAKRYLCAVDEGYHSRLSDASKLSLEYQGGPMSGAELKAFGEDPWCDEMCRVRKWDDEAKAEGLDVGGVEAWRSKVERVLSVS